MKNNTKKYIGIAMIIVIVTALVINYMYPYSALSVNKKIEVDQNKTTTRYMNNLKKLSANVSTLSENQSYNEKIGVQVENVLASSTLKKEEIKKSDLLKLLSEMNDLVKNIGHHVRYQPEYFNENQRSYLIELKNHLQVNSYNTNQTIEDSLSSKADIKKSINELYIGMNQDIELLLMLG
ncbi:hypothetical protein [Exiguobacterium acetylicum]|uniref:hypothetical protein n=1 Tax=Exiguobacterium acetylicum TaxID=41170 RepID=UPI0011EE65D9|nr:hypothetical protein [Exiguobacterium acetylicum]